MKADVKRGRAMVTFVADDQDGLRVQAIVNQSVEAHAARLIELGFEGCGASQEAGNIH